MVTGYNRIQLSRLRGPILAERLISDLDVTSSQRLESIMHSRHYDKGQIIFSSDTVPTEVIVFVKGNAELAADDETGRCRSIGKGEVFGLTEALAGAEYSDTLTALSDCNTSIINRDDLFAYLRQTPTACYRFLEVLAENLHQAIKSLDDDGEKCDNRHKF